MRETTFDVQAKNHEDLVEFYLKANTGKPSLFHIWEDGGSRGDSVTPSTYSADYRSWMADVLVTELAANGGGLLSLGCGNAAVEVEVVRCGYRVFAIDAMPHAVELARLKGVDAIRADIYQWQPEETWSVAYIDGVLGHLYDPDHGLAPVLSRIRSWLAPGTDGVSARASLVASNDAPKNGSDLQQAPGVNGFHWLAADYIGREALAAGFTEADADEYRYHRPLSGERVRSIVTCHVG